MEKEFKLYKVGDVFKPERSKTDYTVVATFEDEGKQFFVAKHPLDGGRLWSYGSVFSYDEDGKVFKRT